MSPGGLRRVYHAALQRIDAVRVSLQESIDRRRLEGAEEAYKRCYEDLSKLSETRYDEILRAVDSLREDTKALRQTVGLGSAGEVSGGVLRAPGIPQRAPSLIRYPTSQVSDGDLAPPLMTSKCGSTGWTDLGDRLRVVHPHPYLKKDRVLFPFKSILTQDRSHIPS